MTSPSNALADDAPAIRTFLIADIRDYTRFTSEHGDEAASRIATKFAALLYEGIEAWGGRLLELRGDEGLAVFASARRALRAADELRDAFEHESQIEPALPLRVGIGLDVGEAVPVGDGYRGAAINVAARLCGVAAAGQVYASEAMIRLVGPIDGLAYAPQRAVSAKGLDAPLVPVAVLRADPHQMPESTALPDSEPPPLPPELDPIVPLAGRVAELRRLRWHWRRATHGHGGTVVVAGPPGIGKTRLAAELATDAHGGGAAVAYVPGARVSDTDVEALAAGPAGLVIVDDLDAAAPATRDRVVSMSRGSYGRERLVLITHREATAPAVTRVAEQLASTERRVALRPLERDDVRTIVALYAGRAVDAVPLDDVVAESGGVPAAVHRVASRWAQAATTERLGSSAERAAAGRRLLREAESDLVGDVAELERARDRAVLYATDREIDEGPARDLLTVCPYKGLASFGPADAEYFFGRERLVAELAARLVGASFLGIVGASGSGKSSALAAGLLPALAGGVLPGSDRWLQVVMRPGDRPLGALARALSRASPDAVAYADKPSDTLESVLNVVEPGGRLVLVVDQFEEVFNAARDEVERSGFIDLLATEHRALTTIVSLRADHYGRCAAYPRLADRIAANHVLVGPLTRSELQAVVEHPAHRVGLRVEPQLVEALVSDVGDEPGGLPLLSTALLELWQAREGRRLTLASYHASGGVRGAVARLAEGAWAALDPAKQSVARSIFLRLAGPGEGEGVVRRRVPLDELDTERDPLVADVLTTLTAARLLTTGDGHVEVAHEALLREWPRLQAWLEEDAAGRQVRLHLIGAARDWEARGREPGDLYRGARLTAALDWAAEHGVELNESERAFLDESRVASERDADRQRRTNRRLRGLLAGAGALLVLAVAAGGFAAIQAERAEDAAVQANLQATFAAEEGNRAEQEAAAAREAEALARSRELAASAIAVLEDDPALSKLLALEAASIADPPIESVTALHTAWSADRIIGQYAWPQERSLGEQLWVDLHPDGRLAVASGGFGPSTTYLEVTDLDEGEVVWSDEVGGSGVGLRNAVFSTDGRLVFAGAYWQPDEGREPPADELGIHVWGAQSGEHVGRFDVPPCGGYPVAVSQRHLLVRTVTAPEDSVLECFASDSLVLGLTLLDLDTGTLELLAPESSEGALSADGRFAAFDDERGDRIISNVLDVQTGDRVMQIDPAAQPELQRVPGVRGLTADGSILIYGDQPIHVWDVARRERIASFHGHSGATNALATARGGTTVYSTGRDGSLREWDARTGRELNVIPAAGGGRVSAHGDRVLVARDESRTAALVDVGLRGEVGALRARSEGSYRKPDEGAPDCFAVADSVEAGKDTILFLDACAGPQGESTTQVVDVSDPSNPTLLQSVPGSAGQRLGVSPDGEQFAQQDATEFMFGAMSIRGIPSARRERTLDGLCTYDNLLVFPTATPGCNPIPRVPFGIWPWQVRWSPDGSVVAVIDYFGPIVIWSSETGEIVDSIPIGTESPLPTWDVIFTPDGARMIVGRTDGRIETFSTDTWQLLDAMEIEGLLQPGFAGFLGDGSTLVILQGLNGAAGAALTWFDVGTMETVRSLPRVHDGSPKSVAMNADGSLIATGASGGLVRIRDANTGDLVHEIQISDAEIQGLAFVDGRLAIVPDSGDVLIYTIHTEELLQIVRDSLTRGFTHAECSQYFEGGCPTLEELQAGN